MNAFLSGTITGLIFGILNVLFMVPFSMPDKSIAMLASFVNRFAIGSLINRNMIK